MVFWEEARGWSARQAPTTITHNSHMFPKELTVVAKTSALISQEFCPSYTLTMSMRKGPLYCEGQRGLERAISPATGPRLSVEVSVSSRASTGQLRCSSATAFPSSTLEPLSNTSVASFGFLSPSIGDFHVFQICGQRFSIEAKMQDCL